MDLRDPDGPPPGVASVAAILALRLVLLFAVIGSGWAVYEHFGSRWFHVFVFLAIAVRLHLEIRWIEKHVPPGIHPEHEARRREHPFRKR